MIRSLLFFASLLHFGGLYGQAQLGNDLLANSVPGRFGTGLAMSQDGDRLLVGNDFFSPGDAIQLGSIQLWEWDGNAWTRTGAPVVGDDNFDKIGKVLSISADGTRFAFGKGEDVFSSTAGLVRVFDLVDDEWVQAGADFEGAFGDRVGSGVSLSADGQLLAVGAAGSLNSSNPAYVTVYAWNGSTWTPRGSVLEEPANSPNFGTTVVLSDDGNRLLVSDNFSNTATASVFTYDWDGSDWVSVGTPLTGQGSSDSYGTHMDLSADGNRLAVGAANYDVGANTNEGYFEVYDWTGSDWARIGTSIYGENSQRLGSSIALSNDGTTLAVGALGDISTDGTVRVYRVADTDLTLATTIEQSGSGFGGDELGAAVALSGSGDRLAVGEPNYFDNDLNSNTGRVRVFGGLVTSVPALPRLAMRIFPNPTDDVIRLSDGGPATWMVSDVLGRLRLRQTTDRLSLAALPAGTYTVRAVRPAGELVELVVKR